MCIAHKALTEELTAESAMRRLMLDAVMSSTCHAEFRAPSVRTPSRTRGTGSTRVRVGRPLNRDTEAIMPVNGIPEWLLQYLTIDLARMLRQSLSSNRGQRSTSVDVRLSKVGIAPKAGEVFTQAGHHWSSGAHALML